MIGHGSLLIHIPINGGALNCGRSRQTIGQTAKALGSQELRSFRMIPKKMKGDILKSDSSVPVFTYPMRRAAIQWLSS
jgi:hypothetical protein